MPIGEIYSKVSNVARNGHITTDSSTINPGRGGSLSDFEINEAEWKRYFDLFNSTSFGNAAYMAAFPGMVQFAEWSQQMLSQMYQNEWNSEPNKMKRMMEAGINPYLAASGIAGAGASPSVSPPNSSAGQGSDFIRAASGGVDAIASAINQSSQGIAQYSKLKGELHKLDLENESIFIGMGFTKLQSRALSISLKYLDAKEQVNMWQCLANFEKTKQEYRNLRANHDNILAQYDEIISNIDLLKAQVGDVEAMKLYHEALTNKTNEDIRWQRIDTQFFLDNHYRLGTPLYDSLRDMAVSDGTFNLEDFGNTIGQYEGKVTEYVEGAKSAASWDYRPQTAPAYAAYVAKQGTKFVEDLASLVKGSTSVQAFVNRVSSDKYIKEECEVQYDDAKSELYANYRHYRKMYREYRHSGASDQAKAEIKQRMDNALNEYKSFTFGKFMESMYNELKQQ